MANRAIYVIWTSDNYQPSETQDQEYVLFIFASGRKVLLNENKVQPNCICWKEAHYLGWREKTQGNPS